jgi:PRC-barrel domain
MEESLGTGLSPLSELDDYEVAEGYPDIRGWALYDEAGRDIGEVKDLLVDTVRDQAVYATVNLDDTRLARDLFGADVDARIPLAAVTLDVEASAIRLTQPLATLVGWRAAGPAGAGSEAAPVRGTRPEPATEDVTAPRAADAGAAADAFRVRRRATGEPLVARERDRGEGTIERDEAMAAVGPKGERDLIEDIRESRERGGESPGLSGADPAPGSDPGRPYRRE